MAVKLLNWKVVLYVVGGVLIILYATQILQVPNKMIDDIFVYEEGDRVVLQVKFNVPVKYENHFPANYGKFLQIKVRLISLLDIDKSEYLGGEFILPGFIEQVPITDVAYEGNVPGGPFLTLRFSEPIKFQLKEDQSMESIFISIPRVL